MAKNYRESVDGTLVQFSKFGFCFMPAVSLDLGRAYLDTKGGSKSSCHNNNWRRDMIRRYEQTLYS